MKQIIMAVLVLFISACTTTAPLSSTSDSDWKRYGFERGVKGWDIEPEAKLSDKVEADSIKSSNYQAYVSGYTQGQAKYCQQNAYELGIKGEVYTGVCDAMDKRFRLDYIRGLHSHSNSM